MAPPPGQGGLFDLVPQVKPLDGKATGVPEAFAHALRADDPALPVEGRFVPPVNYVSDEEES